MVGSIQDADGLPRFLLVPDNLRLKDSGLPRELALVSRFHVFTYYPDAKQLASMAAATSPDSSSARIKAPRMRATSSSLAAT